MIISLVVPVVNPALHIDKLLESIAVAFSPSSIVELVLVNQSGSSILDAAGAISKISVVEILTDKLIPAADARNLGAINANGEFLFFLDDDAVIHASNFDATKLLERLSNLDVLICQRGEMVEGVYCTHWKQKKTSVNQFNFASFIIEWNVIIRKSLFIEAGLFPLIGVGSNHAALSGEIYVLIAKLLGISKRVGLYEYIQISHPSLYKKNNTLPNLLGYYYGAGYAVGLSIKCFSLLGKLYWYTRNLAAVILDFLFRSKKYNETLSDKVDDLGFWLARSRMVGFYDGLLGRGVRNKAWLVTKS
jgi:glycosyltransferase involved in cell wall biosynthesis